jgi:hypothetical protein
MQCRRLAPEMPDPEFSRQLLRLADNIEKRVPEVDAENRCRLSVADGVRDAPTVAVPGPADLTHGQPGWAMTASKQHTPSVVVHCASNSTDPPIASRSGLRFDAGMANDFPAENLHRLRECGRDRLDAVPR